MIESFQQLMLTTETPGKLPEWLGKEGNEGDDIAGVVHEVGQDVSLYKVGDKGRSLGQTLA